MKKVLLKIEGMTCSACSNGLEKYLNKQKGIISATVNLVMNNASVEYDENEINIKKIEEYIKKAGFKSLGIDDLNKEEKENSKSKIECILLGILLLIAIYLSVTNMFPLNKVLTLDKMKSPLLFASTLFLLATFALIIARDILKNGYKNLIHKTPNMDTLVALGALCSYIYSIFNTYMISVGKHEYVSKLYFESVIMIICFVKIGKYIESKNKDKSKEALKELMTITPKEATLIVNEEEKNVTIDEIKIGDKIICKPGRKNFC